MVRRNLRGEEQRLRRLLGQQWIRPVHAARGFLRLRQRRGATHLRGKEQRLRRLLGQTGAWPDRLGLLAINRLCSVPAGSMSNPSWGDIFADQLAGDIIVDQQQTVISVSTVKTASCASPCPVHAAPITASAIRKAEEVGYLDLLSLHEKGHPDTCDCKLHQCARAIVKNNLAGAMAAWRRDDADPT